MRTVRVASVAIDRTAFHFDKPYDYLVPFDLTDVAVEGCRVLVPFGRGNAKRQGVILHFADAAEVDKIKPIISVLDKPPLLSAEMLLLAKWLKEQTFCTYFDALKPLLPAGINMRMVVSYKAKVEMDEGTLQKLSVDERQILAYLSESKAIVERSRLLEIMGFADDCEILENMAKKGFIIRNDEAVRKMNDATVKMARLCMDETQAELMLDRLSAKQQAVLRLLIDAGTASVKEICYFTGVTVGVVNTLVKNGYVELYENEVFRKPYEDIDVREKQEIVLSGEQQVAFLGLLEQYYAGEPSAALLYGVTGSGKTQVFLKLIDEAVKNGRGVIVMVPEIALTPQTLSIFQNRYGNEIALFHSAMSLGQRMDEWKRIKNGAAKIAIGTRSAVFAPFDDIGLIIMDEEQEHTYKSEGAPRFHARDVARFRVNYHKSLLVMASATPSVETFTLASMGNYKLYKLLERYGSAELPEVVTVDMRAEIAVGNTDILSGKMIEALRENYENGKQSILLLNRRGYNTYVSCRACGFVANCPNCSISKTYHSANKLLMCHYCGHSEKFTSKCPECGEEQMKYSGFGTQRLEELLSLLYPSARILRMDTDTTMSRYSHEKHFKAFANGEYDIMIGTQMVAKGLDFPSVTLVGVINADGSLHNNDFRAYERTFSLLTQVVGRSGRGEHAGIAVIQTNSPDNETIMLAEKQDYEAFYKTEIISRKLMIYPPYCDIVHACFVGEDRDLVEKGAVHFFDAIKEKMEREYSELRLILLGPTAAAIPKISNKYRFGIIIKCKNSKRLREMVSGLLIAFGKDSAFRNVTAFVDVNPLTMI